MTPFGAALEAVLRPLRFAAAEDFRHLERVRDLAPTVGAAAERALELAIPRDARRALEAVRELFEGSPEPEGLRRRVERALARLVPLADPGFAVAALERPLGALPGVGPRRAALLESRGLRRIADLLYRLPVRYDDRRTLLRVGELEVGRRATFVARVLLCDFVPSRLRGRPGRVFQAVVGDETGTVNLKWFRGGETMREIVRKGTTLRVTGEVRRWRFSKELLHPEIERLDAEGDGPALLRVVPEYATPEGIHPRTLRRLVEAALAEYGDLVPSWLPPELAAERGLPETPAALRAVHAPPPDCDTEQLRARASPAHVRLVLEELFLLELGLALRHATEAEKPGIALRVDGPRARAAPEALPFRLTNAQRRVLAEILSDLSRPHPMSRLLQGDVGSGKTAVAFLAALVAAESGHQTALMAPTELLAEQHERSLRRLAEAGGATTWLRIGRLSASLPRAQAAALRGALAAGELDLVVGTHALLQEDVSFARLALAIVDEQHRFGVLQRAALGTRGEEGRIPHLLVMTATPIPRTLALTLYGDLDVSVLDELPPGRSPVATHLLRAGEGRRVVKQIRATLARGEQVYVVYPLVEESERSDLRAATESAERIRAAFPEARVDLVHGQTEAAARAAAMARFEKGETQILVSTTVIEVGVDVPNATLMIVEHAERFGLAQLHQLRGRVGRGARPGTCLLVARAETPESEARLRALLETSDGFAIADADLRIRGPGEFLGTRQSGRLPDLRVADLVRDARLVAVARQAAFESVRRDSGLRHQSDLARAVEARWGERLSLAEVG